MLNRREIYLGFAKGLDKSTAASVQRHYLPLGKVGGRPAWLNPVNLPIKKQLDCQNCNFAMPFLLQIYCPGTEDHSFHRYLYVFVCSNPDCYKGTPKQTVKVFRCQLPLKNDYTSSQKIDFADVGEVPDPCFNSEKFKKLCAVCGCYAAKYCSKCKEAYYCSVEHQKLDWKRHDCNPKKILPADDEVDPFKLTKENEFLFCEHAIEMDCDYAVLSDTDESDVESSDENDKEMKRAKELLDELRKEKGNVVDALPEMYENDDADYDQFKRVIDRDPKQILRYDRHGKPLSATDHVSLPMQIPNCPICKSPRTFEFQLMPYILSVIENRGSVSPIDFATVCVYTCSKDCRIDNDGYAEEYAFKQDFEFADYSRPTNDREDEDAENP